VYTIEWAQNLDKNFISPPMPKVPIDYTSIFIGQLPQSTDDNSVRERFRVYGRILGIQVFSNGIGKKAGGFAFVKFDSRDAASKAVKAEVSPLPLQLLSHFLFLF
jgi:RNA recognition motif-containing protein